ncbi:MAG: amidase [Chloroflexota bacterium]
MGSRDDQPARGPKDSGTRSIGVLRQLASHLKTGRIRSTRLIEESLARIDASDLNAIVAVRREDALEDARLVDAALDRGADPGRLAGLPFLVKDIEDAAGLPTTFGSLLHAKAGAATEDGLVAGRLRAEGAILVGKTNVPEFAFEGYTANRLFGATDNPWARGRSPGGSSGGSGAALAAGLAPIATATDVGGSVRIPASLCGLVGLKPTVGLIGRDPILASLDLNSHGVLASTVADTRLLLGILSGPVGGDVGALPRWRADDPRPSPRLIATDRLVPGSAPSAPVARAFAATLEALSTALGQPIERVDPGRVFPGGYDADDWFRIVGVEQAHLLGRETVERDLDRFDLAFGRAMVAALAIPIGEHLDARQRRFRYARELDALLGETGLLVSPTLMAAGWSADGTLDGRSEPGLPGWVYNTEAVNLTGHPAISLPAGAFPDGLPFGIQVIGPRFGDSMLLDLAERWEAACAWPLLAPGYRPLAAALGGD